MYETKLLKLRDVPVFSLADVSQIVSGKAYAKKLLKRLVNANEIKKIKRDCYSFSDDPFLVSTFLVKPSYISSVSALSYHKIITQIPKDVFCFTTKKENTIRFCSEIRFLHTNHFFGFLDEEYEHSKIPIATPEKAVIDSVGIVPFSVFEEALANIRKDRMLEHLKMIKKSCLLKRVGFLLERNNIDVYDAIRNKLNRRYIYLDPIAKRTGKRNRKWGLIVNA